MAALIAVKNLGSGQHRAGILKGDDPTSKQEQRTWSRSPFCAPIAKVRNWCAMGMHRMENRDTFVKSVSGIAGKILHQMDIQRNARKKSYKRIKSGVV